MKHHRHLKSAILASASIVALTSSAAAENFNIPAGTLENALNAYTMQSGQQLLYPNALVKGVRTHGAAGEMAADVALSRILNGTGLSTRHEADATVIVREARKTSSVAPVTRLADAGPVHAAASVETVVVTSSKIKGDIQTVPIAITALSQEQLTSRQIAGGPDLVKEVPNLTFSKTNFTGYNIQIRGIGTQAISVTTDPAVAVAFNDTPFIRNHFFEQEFYDVAQVEVLRGPQGTLYGRNATAGVVNVVSAKPTDQFEAMASADFGNYNNRRFEGMINIPLVDDRLDIRMAGEWTKRDGYSFNETTGEPIDGRNLWSSRVTIGWKPSADIQTYLIWEHFQENDDRLRSGKQLCKTDPGPSSFTAADGTVVPVAPALGGGFALNDAFFSQGCLPTSMYSHSAFEVPNGFSLPFVSGAAFVGLLDTNIDPYAQTTQSTNLRNIQSAIEPKYRAKNDTLEFNASWNITPELTLFSDTGYNRDFLWSTEDYNRFDTSPGVFLVPWNNSKQTVNSDHVFCDPQLGCSDRLVLQDLSDEHAWQLSQEFRLSSDFKGPLNFSVGGNLLHYETDEDYYVFSNTFSLISIDNVNCDRVYQAGVTDDLYCLPNGHAYNTDLPSIDSIPTESPQYMDPNPLSRLNGEGHNYFVSKNPYVLNSYAGFGEIYYNVTPDLKLTGGLRWTDDEKHVINIPSELLVIGYGYPSIGTTDQKWNQWTGRFVANWSPKISFTDQSMFYASFAHGYKAGGANPPGAVLLNADTSPCFTNAGCSATVNTDFPVHPATFKPEFVDAYELGTKNTLADGGVTFNGDVFFYNYKGYQISYIVDRTSVNLNFDATIRGAELEATYEPLPGLKLSFAGGYEDTDIKKNQYAIDLMDRTAGHPGWVVMKPSVGQSSNCIFPEYVAAALVQQYPGGGEGNIGVTACGMAYGGGLDPVTSDYYDYSGPPSGAPAGYPGYDPLSIDPNAPAGVNNGLGLPPNNGEGFAKNVGGNELPNAPHFTTSLTADYTMPMSANWAATLHSDFYWQSQSFARVFNDRPYDKIRGYSNVNAALILTDATGWQLMAYVKNIFDTTAITGDFLNSDDSGLTTNVFLTDPRLYGLRVTKHLDGGAASFFDFLSAPDEKKAQVWLAIGGDYASLSDGWTKFNPQFASTIPDGLPNPVAAEKAPGAGFDEEARLTYQPAESDWVLKAGIRYGRAAVNKHIHQSLAPKTANEIILPTFIANAWQIPTTASCSSVAAYEAKFGFHLSCPFVAKHNQFADYTAHASEQHKVLDFTLGRDIGIGSAGKSTIGAGVRFAQFNMRANAELNTDPFYVFSNPLNPFGGGVKYHEVFDGTTHEKRSFHGIGPELTWDALQPVWGSEADGELTVDWGVNAAMLFGRQSAAIKQRIYGDKCSAGTLGTCGNVISSPPPVDIKRSRNVTVPNLGGYAALSVRYSNAKLSFGYRVDEFFNAMDGGQDAAKKYNHGFYGPYASISIGVSPF